MSAVTAVLVLSLLAGVNGAGECSYEALGACAQSLATALSIPLPDSLSVLDATPTKVREMCSSSTKASVLKCWNDTIKDCEDHGVKMAATDYINSLTYICGDGLEGFAANQGCLKTKKVSFQGCFVSFYKNLNEQTAVDVSFMCSKFTTLEYCMADAAESCGEAAVSWSQKLNSLKVEYLARSYDCHSRHCTKVGLDSCSAELNHELGISLSSVLGIVEAPPAKVKAVCSSTTKTRVTQCWRSKMNGCGDSLVNWAGDGLINTMEYICDKGMAGFESYQGCLKNKKGAMESCYIMFLTGFDGNTAYDSKFMCGKYKVLDTCMENMIRSCGENAVTWTRELQEGFDRYVRRNYKCSAMSTTAGILTVTVLYVLSKWLA